MLEKLCHQNPLTLLYFYFSVRDYLNEELLRKHPESTNQSLHRPPTAIFMIGLPWLSRDSGATCVMEALDPYAEKDLP